MTKYVFENAQYDIYGNGFSTYAEIEATNEDGEKEYFSLVNIDGMVNYFKTEHSVFDELSEPDPSDELIEYLEKHQLPFSSYEEVYTNPDYPFFKIQRLLIYFESGDEGTDELIENSKGRHIDDIQIPYLSSPSKDTDDSSESKKEAMILKKMRWGYDGGGIACGPVEGNTMVEAAVVTNGEIWFVLDSRMSEYEHVYVSRIPFFDRLMISASYLVNFNMEFAMIEDAKIEDYDFVNYELEADDSMYESRFANVIKLCRLAMEDCYEMSNPNDQAAEEWVQNYLDEDLNKMDIPIVVHKDPWDEEDDDDEIQEKTPVIIDIQGPKIKFVSNEDFDEEEIGIACGPCGGPIVDCVEKMFLVNGKQRYLSITVVNEYPDTPELRISETPLVDIMPSMAKMEEFEDQVDAANELSVQEKIHSWDSIIGTVWEKPFKILRNAYKEEKIIRDGDCDSERMTWLEG